MALLKKLHLDPRMEPSSRRSLLLKEMAELEGKKIDCFNCTGTCCTFVANSMQITPLEALEILDWLNLDQSGLKDLSRKLKQTVSDYRLDHDLNTGKKALSHFRRTYTCPFFHPGPKGCSLSRSAKPYGCLAFNPRISGDSGSQCKSNTDLLIQRENEFSAFEDEANAKISAHYNISWKKLDLPRALLHFIGPLIDP